MSAIVVAGFPGVGKSYYFKTHKHLKVFDTDEYNRFVLNTAGKPNKRFPANFIQFIQSKVDKVDVIFIPTRKEMLNAFKTTGLSFTIVYPSLHLKDLYLERYKNRGSHRVFIQRMSVEFEQAVGDVEAFLEKNPTVRSVKFTHPGQYLVDVMAALNHNKFF